MTEEARLKQKEIRKKFKLARVYLNDSQKALQSGGVRLATDGAYNAIELVMRAAILHKGETIPKRHGGIAQRFSLLFVKTGDLPADFGGGIKEGLNLRNKSRYDEEAEITKEHAVHNITLAEQLIEFLEKELSVGGVQEPKSGLGLIGVLLIIGALIITAGGVVVWEKKVKPTPIPTPTPQVLPTPTISPTWPQSCKTDNDCPKQFCQPPGQPCPQYYCIQGKCQLVEPSTDKQGMIIGSLGEGIKLTPGQTVNIAGTNLSLTLLKITTPAENCFDCPTTAEVEVRSGANSEKIYFTVGVLATEEVEAKLRVKEVFGFKITREELRPEWIILTVQKL